MAKIMIDIDTGVETLEAVLMGLGFVRVGAAATRERVDRVEGGAAPGMATLRALMEGPDAPVGSTTVQFTDKPKLTVVNESGSISKETWDKIDPEAVSQGPTLSDMDGDRKRGEAGPGHRRRTNAQIAADEAYFKQKERAEAALKEMDKGVHGESQGRYVITGQSGVEAVDVGPLSISSGEERVNPEDAEDEAGEAHSGPPTLEDLRAEVAKYIETFGVKASVDNMRGIIGCRIDQVPAEEIPNAIAKVRTALGGAKVLTPNSPADGSPVKDEPATELATATKEMVVEIIKAYGRKFDGSDDPEKMVIAKEDLPKVFAKTFGAGVTGMGSMPEKTPEAFGKAWRAIRDAVEKNPFGRKAK